MKKATDVIVDPLLFLYKNTVDNFKILYYSKNEHMNECSNDKMKRAII